MLYLKYTGCLLIFLYQIPPVGRKYMEEIRSGKSSLLKNVTSGYHYHTVRAERVEILDMIQEELQKKGLLAKLQDYEPVDFWGQKNYNE